jgi:hypothetical protein
MSRTRNGVYRHCNSKNYYFKVKNEQGEWIERSTGTSDYAVTPLSVGISGTSRPCFW